MCGRFTLKNAQSLKPAGLTRTPPPASLKQLLVPAPEDGPIEWPLSRMLNTPQHEGPGCAEEAS